MNSVIVFVSFDVTSGTDTLVHIVGLDKIPITGVAKLVVDLAPLFQATGKTCAYSSLTDSAYTRTFPDVQVFTGFLFPSETFSLTGPPSPPCSIRA